MIGSAKNELLLRTYLVLFGFLAFALLLMYRTVDVSVIEGERWRAKGDSTYVKFMPIDADRGDILADDGSLLATSMPLFEIRMDTRTPYLTDEIFNDNIDSLSILLSQGIMDKSPSEIKQYLRRKRRKGDRYVLIAKDLKYNVVKRMQQFPIFKLGKNKGGFIAIKKSHRIRPYRRLAYRTIGLHRPDSDQGESNGIENAFDLFLQGEAGKRLTHRVAHGVYLPVSDENTVEPKSGDNIQTSLNIRMQDIADQALMSAMIGNKAEWGTAILMDVETGGVKAMSNLVRMESGGYWEGYNHAIGTQVAPGSTFKLPIMAALLEHDLVNLEDSVDLENGRWKIYDKEAKDSHWHPDRNVTVRKAFEESSNVGMAKIVHAAYRSKKADKELLADLKRMGFEGTSGPDLKGAKDVSYISENKWSNITAEWMAQGYSLSMTPMHILKFYNAVANGGRMMKPHLVTGVYRDGQCINKYDPIVENDQIVKPEVNTELQKLLEGVVLRGTGTDLKTDRYTIAGKTGTAIVDYWKRAEKKMYRASFAGYFPADKPRFSCIVVIHKPDAGEIYGADVAGPVFREISDRVMAMEFREVAGIQSDSLRINKGTYYSVGYRDDLIAIHRYMEINQDVDGDSDYAVTLPHERSDYVSVKSRKVPGRGVVPDLKNMGLRDAIYLLEKNGMKVKARGYGKVIKQSIQPGAKALGQEIEIILG